MDQKTMDILNRDLEVHYKPGPRGTKYPFVEGKDVIATLNAAFNHEWSSKLVNIYKEDTQIIMCVEVCHGAVSHVGFGGSPIALHTQGANIGKPVDLANSYKSAFTNAIKKAAAQFGVGLMADDYVEDPVQESAFVDNAQNRKQPQPTHHRVENSTVVSSRSSTIPADTSDITALSAAVAAEMERIQKNSGNENNVPFPTTPVQTVQAKPAYNPQEARIKDENSPFAPSGNGNEKINDIQINAIKGLLKVKKLSFDEVSSSLLSSGSRPGITIETLTREEAKQVIQALNKLRSNS